LLIKTQLTRKIPAILLLHYQMQQPPYSAFCPSAPKQPLSSI
jgi:hypothetical protein